MPYTISETSNISTGGFEKLISSSERENAPPSFNMSLRFSIANFYKDFPTATVEDLQGRLEKQKEKAPDPTWLPEGCSCGSDSYPSIFTYIENEYLYAEFCDKEELCLACQTYYNREDYASEGKDSRLLKEGVEFLENTLHSAIVAKKKGYDSMTQEQLEAEADSISSHERYLNRTAISFSWSEEDTPTGLLNEMGETEEELDAIQFEICRRKALGEWATAD
jgi:hypothetical protein